MTSKHTPGPWYVGREDENTGEIEVNSDGRPYVCLVFPGAIDEVTPANARLIAAAPELLEALIEATACGMVPISSAKDGGASTHSRQVRCADMIRAAIAKATGEPQCAS
ncbi:hypothetical protein [Stenotrophomonas sp.]|uniref:hypothetical protein n=1 Tax=Stenotrophomonas sp. TaxID=69392 RepID=UPI002898CEDF|nr:hypothetical protein [Stenotrophomonas sp.]